jgi:hypothetical protein
MKEIIKDLTMPENIIELSRFIPHKNKYYAVLIPRNSTAYSKGIIMAKDYVGDFVNCSAHYVVMAMEGFCRNNSCFDANENRTLIEFIKYLHEKGVKVFEFDTFKEMTDWLNA